MESEDAGARHERAWPSGSSRRPEPCPPIAWTKTRGPPVSLSSSRRPTGWVRGAPPKTTAPAEARPQAGRLMRRSRMRTCVIAAFAGALALVSPSLSVAAGALAIDENQGDQWGWAVGYSTQAGADRKAMEECGHGCRIVERFSNSCAAYAADQSRGSTAYGWASGFSSTSAAQSRSLQECRRRGGAGSNCIVRAWGCDQPQARSASPGSQQPRQASQPEVRKKPTRSTVRRVQADLARLGYKPGPADGIAGRRTAAAVKRFQSDSGLPADGRITGALVAKLQAAVGAGKGTSPQPRPEKAQAASKETPAAAPAGKAGDLWGSIAYSPTSRLGVIVWNSGGRGAAKQQSLQGCRRDGGIGCKEVAWFQNACGAIAIGRGTGYGGGWGESKAESERMALSNCRSAASNCKVEVSRCTDTAAMTAQVERAPTKKEPVVVTEPKCRFGPEIYNEKERAEKNNTVMASWENSYARGLNWEASRGIYISLLDRERDGMKYETCWLEVSNIPGCQIFIGVWNEKVGRGTSMAYNGPFSIPRPEIVRWSGECVNGVVEGEGKLKIVLPGWHDDGKFHGPVRLYRVGKRHGSARYIFKGDKAQCTTEGRYENGLRQGEWKQSCRNCVPGLNGKFVYVDGEVMDCPGIGRWEGVCQQPCS